MALKVSSWPGWGEEGANVLGEEEAHIFPRVEYSSFG